MSGHSLTDGFLTNFLEGAIHGAADRLFHRPTRTDPAVIAAWAEWQTPDQWADQHGRSTQ
ncbi:hypothetical protein NONO_c59820 [Nocardia nova SH22a]|uniref:Uncharacterized protein n=1 Tax=Nocardia nova SH22a TaxID=1415166 RepID=W5TP81_9NOCA|nr:hypothetical protein [Nocardia nova]AHH20758.1 hypothetical protein NONO_c59820 [Nocardia nova SH22a]